VWWHTSVIGAARVRNGKITVRGSLGKKLTGMVVHTCIPGMWEAEVGDSEFEADPCKSSTLRNKLKQKGLRCGPSSKAPA
jgi:hypothetical protein